MIVVQRRERPLLYPVGGCIWSIPAAVIPEGDLSDEPRLGGAVGSLINRSVANQICGSPEPLTANQLIFLCQISGTKNSEVADHLGINRSNISVWTRNDRLIPKRESGALKKWFWRRLFGEALGEFFGPVPTEVMFNEQVFLRLLCNVAIESGAAVAVTEEKPHHERLSSGPTEDRKKSTSFKRVEE